MQEQETYDCSWCSTPTEVDEYVNNFGICNSCFDASYEQYIEETAGPHDWIVAP